jgi:hypothetical protein
MVRNGRVFDLSIADIKKEYPSVNTYITCKVFAESRGSRLKADDLDENFTRSEFHTLDVNYLPQFNMHKQKTLS